MSYLNSSAHFIDNGTIVMDYIGPIYDTLLNHSEKYLQIGKDALISYLKNDEATVTIKTVISNSKIPIGIFSFLISFVLAFALMIPISCLLKKKSINIQTNRGKFFVESLLLTCCTIGSLIGIAMYLHVVYKVFEHAQEYPKVIQKTTGRIEAAIKDFERQVRRLESDVDGRKGDIRASVTGISGRAVNVTEAYLQPDIGLALSSLNYASSIYDDEEFASTEDIKTKLPPCNESDLEEALRDFQARKRRIRRYLSKTKRASNWKRHFSRVLERRFKPEVTNILRVLDANETKLFLVNQVLRSSWSMYGSLEKLYNETVNCSQASVNVMNARLGPIKINFLWIIFLLPIICLIFYISPLCCGSILALQEIKRLSDKQRESEQRPKSHRCIFVMKVSLVSSAIFLSFSMMLASLVYILIVSLLVVCKSVSDGSFVNQYVDNPKVWNNGTWMDMAMSKNMKLHGVKLGRFLDVCASDGTILFALNINETKINIDARNVTMDFGLLHLRYLDALPGSRPSLEPPPVTANPKDLCWGRLRDDETMTRLPGMLSRAEKIVETVRIYTAGVDKKFNSLEREGIGDLLKFISFHNAQEIVKLWTDIDASINGDVGQCKVIPESLQTLHRMTCHHFTLILLALLMSLAVVAGCMLIGYVLTHRLIFYIQGIFDHFSSTNITNRYSDQPHFINRMQ